MYPPSCPLSPNIELGRPALAEAGPCAVAQNPPHLVSGGDLACSQLQTGGQRPEMQGLLSCRSWAQSAAATWDAA